MKNLIKLAILLIVLAIFAFSTNPTIEKVRNFTTEKGKVLYEKGVEKMGRSENETMKKISEGIK